MKTPLFVWSLWQPWASLHVTPTRYAGRVAKVNETRHFGLDHPMLRHLPSLPITVVIHAAKRWTRDQREMCAEWPFTSCLDAIGFTNARGNNRGLPFGALIGTVEYTGVRRVEDVTFEFAEEQRLGNYEPGRFAWVSRNQRAFPEPIPFKGRQDVLYPLPVDYVAAVERQMEMAHV